MLYPSLSCLLPERIRSIFRFLYLSSLKTLPHTYSVPFKFFKLCFFYRNFFKLSLLTISLSFTSFPLLLTSFSSPPSFSASFISFLSKVKRSFAVTFPALTSIFSVFLAISSLIKFSHLPSVIFLYSSLIFLPE